MRRLIAVLAFAGTSVNAQTVTQVFGSGAYSFSMDFVTIGNPNNTADTTGSPNPAGSVPYVYNIGKFEVSRDMVLKANTFGGLGITLDDLASPRGSQPAAGVSWNEGARFVNWLNESKGYQKAYNFTTSGGNDNITLWGAGQYGGNNQFRHKDAVFVLPTRDEWYKAAYGSPSGTWYNFPNGSDSAPNAVPSGTADNTAVYGQITNTGPADITNAGGLSAYGTMAQGGNVWEWNETAYDGINDSVSELRELRGGNFSNFYAYLDSTSRQGYSPRESVFSIGYYGFRVAMIPEPSSLSLLLAGGAVLMAGRRVIRGYLALKC